MITDGNDLQLLWPASVSIVRDQLSRLLIAATSRPDPSDPDSDLIKTSLNLPYEKDMGYCEINFCVKSCYVKALAWCLFEKEVVIPGGRRHILRNGTKVTGEQSIELSSFRYIRALSVFGNRLTYAIIIESVGGDPDGQLRLVLPVEAHGDARITIQITAEDGYLLKEHWFDRG